jgi:CDP-paratose 2-epimerase
MATPRNDARAQSVLITGGAGFIGTNLAARLLRMGKRVLLLDNLSRGGVEENCHFLRRSFGDAVRLIRADINDRDAVRSAVSEVGQVFHFAAQVAVTTSLSDPLRDFETNARGALNVLEALRQTNPGAGLVFTSTNKVYGDLEDVGLVQLERSYAPSNAEFARFGIAESRGVQFHSPYGCSKGAADQYVLDYARTFGLRTAVFRMSCIYGPHQFGNEDQGWVAHFILRALADAPITLYGDGRQVRDILFIDDLVDAFLKMQEHIDEASGEVFNIGGGPANAVSLVEVLDLISEMRGRRVEVTWAPWRARPINVITYPTCGALPG